MNTRSRNINNTATLRSIFTQTWMIDHQFAMSYMPSVLKMLNGDGVSHFGEQTESHYYKVDDQGNKFPKSAQVSNATAIIPIKGVITKYDQECGPDGTMTINDNIIAISKDPNITNIILDIDTPGGQAAYLSIIHETIKNVNKPVVAIINDLCCSAGYYIASAADEIYATEKTDTIGSIGSMCTFYDFKGYLEKEGIVLHEVYADQSSAKNRMFKEALEGKYDILKKEMLNPSAQSFIDAVKSSRKIDEKKAPEVYQGATYLADEAISIGLIDGILTYAEVLERARLLANTKTTNQIGIINQNKTNKMPKNLTTIASLLGVETIESHEGFVSLSIEQMEAIDTELVARAANSQSLATSELVAEPIDLTKDENFIALQSKVNSAVSTVNEMNKTLTQLLDKIPGAAAATSQSKGDDFQDDVELEEWENPNSAFNMKAKSAIETGSI